VSFQDTYEPHGAQYKRLTEVAPDKSDESILKQLRGYKKLNFKQRRMPQFRHWRRMLVREALRRGLIDEDPGGAP
jgi:hypothetical protein